MLRPFDIWECHTMAEAVAAKQELEETGSVYAGGTELLLVMKQGFARYEHMIDVKGIPELNELDVVNGRVRVGAATVHRKLEHSDIIRDRLALMAEVESYVANVRVRNVGTIGGNLCFAEPHSDLALVTILLDGVLTVAGASGERRVPAESLVTGPYETCLQPDEILKQIDFPVTPAATATGYQRFQFHERPSCAVGVIITASEDGQGCESALVAVGAAGPTPRRVREAEALFVGRSLNEVRARARDAGRKVAAAADPLPNQMGSEQYIAHLVEVLVERATLQALARLHKEDVQ